MEVGKHRETSAKLGDRVRLHATDSDPQLSIATLRRRAPWRQRLIDAERGVVLGLRADSNLFAFFFSACIISTTGLVLGLPLGQWTLLALGMTLVLVSELVRQSIRAVVGCLDRGQQRAAERALKIAAGSVFVAYCGLTVIAGLTLGSRLLELLVH